MTIDQVCGSLHTLVRDGVCLGSTHERTKWPFRVSSFGSIVTDDVPVSEGTYAASPIMALYRLSHLNDPPLSVADERWMAATMKIAEDDTTMLIAACQGYRNHRAWHQALRNRLLEACNLPTEPYGDVPTRPDDPIEFHYAYDQPTSRLSERTYAAAKRLERGYIKDPAEFVALYREITDAGFWPSLFVVPPGQNSGMGQLHIKITYDLPPLGTERFAKSCEMRIANMDRGAQGLLQVMQLLLDQDKIRPMRQRKVNHDEIGSERTRVVDLSQENLT